MKRLLFYLIGLSTPRDALGPDGNRAVDCYLKDYQRVKTAYEHKHDLDYIHMVTGIAKHVVKQYVEIMNHDNF